MELAANALTTLLQVQTHLSAFDPVEAAELNWLINVASDRMEAECNRAFAKTLHTAEAYLGDGRRLLALRQYPVLSVSLVTLGGEEIGDFSTDPAAGLLFRQNGWPKHAEISVTYDAGYVLPKDASDEQPRTLPFELEAACVLLVAQLYNQRGSEHLSAEAVGPLKWTYLEEIPAVRASMNKYRRPLL